MSLIVAYYKYLLHAMNKTVCSMLPRAWPEGADQAHTLPSCPRLPSTHVSVALTTLILLLTIVKHANSTCVVPVPLLYLISIFSRVWHENLLSSMTARQLQVQKCRNAKKDEDKMT